MSHEPEATIGSSSSWVPFMSNSSPDISQGNEADYLRSSHVGSSNSTRPATPKLSASLMVAHSPTRPPLGRSATAPHIRKRYSTSPRLNTNLGREWTVFGQLMENEGQLTPNSPSFKRRGGTTIDTTPRGSLMNSFASFDVQSPVAEEELARPTAGEDDSDSESIYSSESDESSHTSPLTDEQEQGLERKPKWYSLQRKLPDVPVLYRNIFKCAFAYFLASLFTFNPYLSGFISDIVSYSSGVRRPLPSGHMVATVAVYFNPAKSMGGMIEADFFCIFGVLYSAFICLSCMTVFWWLDVQPAWVWLADLVAIVWIGVGMSFLAWMKVYMENPQFNTAGSMMAIIIFIVLVKEGGFHTLLQVAIIVLCGAVVSNLVCYLIWPQSATDTLRSNMTKTIDSFSTLLEMLTETFLLDEPVHHRSQGRIQRAVEAHQSSFTSLRKNLKEAQSEWILWGRLRSPANRLTRPIRESDQSDGGRKKAYQDAVDSLNRLAQHLNGLRSGTRLQYELTRAGAVQRNARRDGKNGVKTGSLVDVPSAVDEDDEDLDDEEAAMIKAALVMFGDLVDDLGPPMRALSSTCTTGLKRLKESFLRQPQNHSSSRTSPHSQPFNPSEFSDLVSSIDASLLRFESTSNHAVMRLYRKSDLIRSSNAGLHQSRESFPGTPVSVRSGKSGRGRSNTLKSDVMDRDNAFFADGGDGTEHVFLVYFFIFTLQEFAREMTGLVDAMERIYAIEEQRLTWGKWWGRIYEVVRRNWSKWRTSKRKKPTDVHNENGRNNKKGGGGIRKRLSRIIIPHQTRTYRAKFPQVTPHAPDTIQTPSRKNLTFVGRMKQGLWSLSRRFNQRDTKFAIKTGMATAILAAPAFFDKTRPFFVAYYGDWALISFFVVMSPTIGATNFLGFHRILGTLLGAAVAAGIFSLFPKDAIVLSIFGFFFSIPCFYYLVGKPVYASSARFVLLTYNLTCLYCYNLREKDLSITKIAYHRAVSVTAGVVWAAIVSRFWWPAEARRELSKTLGEFSLNLGWLYTRLVMSNSFTPEDSDEFRGEGESEGESERRESSQSTVGSSSERPRMNGSIKEFMAMELHLQIKLIEIQGLLAQAQHEPRLKGPFPVGLYRGILTSLQTILDKLHSMRCVTTREEWYTSVRQDFIIPVNRERRAMSGNIILYFATLASAFRLKAPLPPYLPPAEDSRQQLVHAIRQLEVVRNRDVKGSKQLLFFAYAMAMKGVTQELETLGRILQDAFGVIGQSTAEFEALFLDTEDKRRQTDYLA